MDKGAIRDNRGTSVMLCCPFEKCTLGFLNFF